MSPARPPKPDGQPAGMLSFVDDLTTAAQQLEADAAATRGHLLGFRGPAADRMRDYLADLQNKAHDEATDLYRLGSRVMDEMDNVEKALRTWHHAGAETR